MECNVRAETAADQGAVESLHEKAFGGPVEARLVRALRDAAPGIVSLVAVGDGRPVGHILFTPVIVEGPAGRTPAMALGPMAVEPELQRKGIGSALVRAGLQACRDAADKLVFVLGHVEYYPRFGFRPAAPAGFHYRSSEFDPYFMMLELEPGSAPQGGGMVCYHPEFELA